MKMMTEKEEEEFIGVSREYYKYNYLFMHPTRPKAVNCCIFGLGAF